MISVGFETTRRIRTRLVDVALLAASVAALLPFLLDSEPWRDAAGILACAAVLLCRWNPVVAVGLALPGFIVSEALVPVAVTLTMFSMRERRRAVLVGVVGVVFLAWIIPERIWEAPQFIASTFLLGGVYVGLPVAVGLLLRTRRELAERVEELILLRTRERLRAAEDAVIAERSVLAREMHDVVSHHVTVIAVQAAALQVGSADPETRSAAERIRASAAVTIDELQAMVQVLRHADGPTRRQRRRPTAADLPALIAGSCMSVRGSIAVPDGMSLTAQQVIYRFVQEGLTNAAKHSSGAAVTLASRREGSCLLVSVVAGRATAPAPMLRSATQGLLGLRERAEMLGGTVTTTLGSDGSHELTMSLPVDE